MGKLISKIFGTYSERQVKHIMPLVEQIEALAETYSQKTDEELKATTSLLKDRLAHGETLDDILPDAYAAIREADARVLGKRPFTVQIIGGILLHQGRIAEMKTGEGKTLVATLPAYLNALAGKGVHIVTVNDYLARCGKDEMGRVYAFMGLTTGLVVADQSHADKKAAYEADITYGTNNEFGFDYLRDNMVLYRHQKVQRGHHFAIVDEVDSILIDEARTPLIISGGGDESTDLYEKADQFARRLKKHVIRELDAKSDAAEEVDADYIVDEKANTTILTRRGIAAAERFFGIENLSDPENTTLNHHINQAIRAHGIMKRDVDYVVKDDQIVIVDTFTGRLMPGRRYNNGLHQAIEAKERVGVQRESKTLATITFQNYFRMYRKLSGMTGTALTEDREFREIYRLDVVEVPTNKPMIRLDHTDRVYRTKAGKLRAIVEQIKECHEKGQPVLVGTISIEKSEELSKLLTKAGIKHTVLNAKYHEKEAEIVAQAGQVGAVTVSTNMAGRGTDIMLGGNPEFLAKAEMRRQGMAEEMIIRAYGMDETTDEEVLKARALFATLVEKYKAEIAPQADRVRAAGGLFILGTERHESRRIDNQLRGRSGRQGDPGESRFYLSFEDDLLRLFGADRMLALSTHMGLDEDTPIQFKMLANGIENAQKQLESNNFERRKNVLEYDDVMNQQRQLIYKERNEVLDGIDLREKIEGMIVASVARNLAEIREAHPDEALTPIMMQGTYLQILLTANERVSGSFGEIDLAEVLTERALECYHQKDQLIGSETMREIERIILLRNVDAKWMEHLDAMEELKGDVGLNAYAQRNPVSEFRIVGSQMFDEMIDDVREWTVRGVLTVMPKSQPKQRVQVAKAQEAGAQRAMSEAIKKPRMNPRAPCHCGSGKQYRFCCGAVK